MVDRPSVSQAFVERNSRLIRESFLEDYRINSPPPPVGTLARARSSLVPIANLVISGRHKAERGVMRMNEKGIERLSRSAAQRN